ncbi:MULTISPECIES: lipopolysaccharide biosynthesis protein [Thalassospira]|uniref:Polysaccharide biosynthesis protein n=2 Tax=Thalassospira TaxID=168934 RepID=A0A367WCL5_9PROT|nr:MULTISPECIES: lipopolysaccharide biosynthesis protein [Thalassospira]MDG4717404.1 lipopolysaccharide biosynthesis protein [Thalassospira sp. FZY0004]RCK39117.1 hypothetical protein TH19_04885 [Thalassospira profundimaris]
MIHKASRKTLGFLKSDLGVRFVAEGFVRSNAFILTPLLSWSLGAAVFGSYLQIMSLSFAFVPLVSAGLGFTLIRKLAGHSDSSDAPRLLVAAITIVSILCLILVVILALAIEEIATYLSLVSIQNADWLIFAIPVLAWLFAIEALIGEYLRAMIKARKSLYAQIAGFAIQMLLIAVILTFGRLSLETALFAIAAAKFSVILCLLTPELIRLSRFDHSRNRSNLLQVSISGLPFMLAGLAEWAGNLGDRLIVGRFLGAEAVAQYGASIMILSILSALGAPIWWLLFPKISGHVRRGEIDDCCHVAKCHTMLFAELALPALALAILIVNPAVSILLNSQVGNLTPVIIVAGFAILTSQMTTGWEYYLVSISSGKRLMSAAISCSLLGFITAWQLAPIWGLTGIACGILLGKLCLAAFFGITANRNGFDGWAWPFAKIAALSCTNSLSLIATYWLVQGLTQSLPPIYEIAITLLIYTIIYGAGRLLLKPALPLPSV